MNKNLAILRRRSRKILSRSRGFTLVELMITIIIAVILVTLAAPSFSTYMANQRVRNASYDLSNALMIARSEAIKRNAAMNVVRTGSVWGSGWQVQFPGTSPATVIRSQEAYANVSISDSANLSTVSFGVDGRVSTGVTTFKVQPATSMSGVSPRCVFVTPSGTPRSLVGGC